MKWTVKMLNAYSQCSAVHQEKQMQKGWRTKETAINKILKYKIHINDKLAVEQVNFEEQLGKNNNCIMKQEVRRSTGKMECMIGV